MKKLVLLILALILFSCSNNGSQKPIEATGTIETTEVTVSSKVPGEIKKLFFGEGKKVAKGDTLSIIDHTTLKLQLKQAEAGVTLTESQLNLLIKGARIEDIEQAEEALKQAETNLNSARADLERMTELYGAGSATEKQKDDAEARFSLAKSQYNSAKQMLKKLQQFARPEEIQSARAKLEQAEANVELIKEKIADSYITAPLSGIVTSKPFEEGELIGTGAGVTTISDQSKVNLMIYVTEPELGHVKIGQKAEISIDSHPERTFEGEVVYISPKAEFTPKNIQTKKERVKLVFGVKLELENPDGILKAGMPADAVLR